jgi:hypothetical protein
MAIGRWLSRKVDTLASRTFHARQQVAASERPVQILRREWAGQIASQTKPHPSRFLSSRWGETDHLIGHSPKAAALAVGRIVLLRSELSDAEDSLSVLKECLMEAEEDQQEAIAEAEGNVLTLKAKVEAAERALGTSLAQTTLAATQKDKYLECRLRALATKQRLLVRLQARKFEFSKLNQHSGRPVLGLFLNYWHVLH